MFGDICNKHAPFREINFRQYAPAWMSGDYLAHVDEKKYHCKEFNRNPTQENLTLKMEAIARTNALRQSLQRSYFQETLRNCKGNMKEMWRTIKKFWPYLNKSSTSPKSETPEELSAIANSFNDFFVNVGPSQAAQIPPVANPDPNIVPNIGHNPPVFEFVEPSLEEIVSIIQELAPTNACSLDGITLRLIKSAGPAIIPCITHICCMSIRYHCFPDAWKVAVVTPLHKSGNTDLPTNYRPISVLPCLGKILERIIHTQLYSYLAVNNLLTPSQSGFRKGHSTGTCLTSFLDNIFENVEQGCPSGVLFLDLSKAFDTVDHQIILDKLREIGLKWSAISWIRSYLSNRVQVTKINGVLSGKGEIQCGVPQGSILGPLLFTIYINDILTNITHGNTYLYADDTAVVITADNPIVMSQLLTETVVELDL